MISLMVARSGRRLGTEGKIVIGIGLGGFGTVGKKFLDIERKKKLEEFLIFWKVMIFGY